MTSEVMSSKEQVNYLKGWAIMAVVAIHIANILLSLVKISSVSWTMLVLIDQISRFSVPFFVTLSGYALAKKYLTANFYWKDFYVNRLLRLLPLYLVWTAVYYISGKIGTEFNNFGSVADWINIIINGRGYYHLYFVPMIFKAYLVFPLIYWCVKKYPTYSVIGSAVIQYIVFNYINKPGWTDQTQYVMFLTWQIYFVLGIFLANGGLKKLIKQNLIYWLVAIVGLGWVIKSSFLNLYNGVNLIWATRFTRWSVMMYSVGLVMASTNREVNLTFLKQPKQIITFLGKHSYLIYLSHVLFLQVIFNSFTQGKITWKFTEIIVVGICALLLSIKMRG